MDNIPNLDFLQEPALVVDRDGLVLNENHAARDLFGAVDKGSSLFDVVQEDRSAVASYLRRASGSTSPHIGALEFTVGERVERFRALGARIQCGDTADVVLVVRLMPIQDDQFTTLNRRLREADQQLHKRMKENALLQEALAENKVLVRELQHRVKNNIQQMLSLIKMSAANQESDEVATVVATASHRLQAMSKAQEAMYQNDSASTISARSFLGDVARGVADSFGTADALDLSVEDLLMTGEEAHCIALIASELITNAFKYGLPGGGKEVVVRFGSEGQNLVLKVHDDGPGFDMGTAPRVSGLRLVRSLCRQIGGKLEVEDEGGAKCSVNFRSERG